MLCEWYHDRRLRGTKFHRCTPSRDLMEVWRCVDVLFHDLDRLCWTLLSNEQNAFEILCSWGHRRRDRESVHRGEEGKQVHVEVARNSLHTSTIAQNVILARVWPCIHFWKFRVEDMPDVNRSSGREV